MPLPISLAHRLAQQLALVRHDGTLDYLRPDGKTQVSVRYVDGAADGGREAADLHPARTTARRASASATTSGSTSSLPVLPADMYDADALRREFLVNPTGPLRHRRPRRRLRADRAQDHRRHVRRDGAPRRRRVQRQGSVEGRPLGRVRGALGGEEHRRRGPGRSLRGAGRVRDRRRAPGQRDGRDVRHREDRARAGSPRSSTSTSTCARARFARSSTCIARSTRRPPRTATSGATTRTSRGSRPARPTCCATPPASPRAPRPEHGHRRNRRRGPDGLGHRRGGRASRACARSSTSPSTRPLRASRGAHRRLAGEGGRPRQARSGRRRRGAPTGSSYTTRLDDLADCELVVEAVTEDRAIKCDVFRRLDERLPREVILASNTSSIPITTLAQATSRPRPRAGTALLLAGPGHGARRDRPGLRDEPRGHRCHRGVRAPARQARDPLQGSRRLRREPAADPVPRRRHPSLRRRLRDAREHRRRR